MPIEIMLTLGIRPNSERAYGYVEGTRALADFRSFLLSLPDERITKLVNQPITVGTTNIITIYSCSAVERNG